MAFLARRIIVSAAGTPLSSFPPGVQGHVAIQTTPTLQIGTQSADTSPDYYDIIDDGTVTYSGYTTLYTANLNQPGGVTVTLNNLPTGPFPHNWAGWPAAVGP